MCGKCGSWFSCKWHGLNKTYINILELQRRQLIITIIGSNVFIYIDFMPLEPRRCLLPVQYERYTEILADTQIGFVASCGFPSFQKCEIVRPHFVDCFGDMFGRRDVTFLSGVTHIFNCRHIFSSAALVYRREQPISWTRGNCLFIFKIYCMSSYLFA